MGIEDRTPYEQIILKNITKAKDRTEKSFGQQEQQFLFKKDQRPSVFKPLENITKPKEISNKIKIYIGKDCRVYVKPSSKPVALILSKLSGSSYDIKNNEWSFDVENYDVAIKEFSKNKLLFDKIPPGTLILAKKTIKSDIFPFEGGIYDLLMDFQRDSVNFAINRNGRILLADDMGLGKTIQALAIANYYKLEYPLLILAPASLCFSWVESISQFLGENATFVRDRCDLGDKISVMSYSIAVNIVESISLVKYGVVICDECHYFKSLTSKRTKLLLPILQKSPRLIMISGTPATSRPLELYPILCALDKSLYPSFPVYGNRYCDAHKRGLFMDYRGCSNALELSIVIEKAFMIRRLKDQVLSQLPKKFRRQVFLDTKANKINLQLKGDFIGENPDAQLMIEYKEAAMIKKEPVIKYLESVLDKNIKCLVFAHHKEMLDGLEDFCKEKQVKYIRIDGGTLQGKRQGFVDQYQKDSNVRIAILSLTAASTGLTLTEGKAVVFAELYWNPGTMLQAEDRIHRIGQVDSVDIHYLVAKNTIDELVWPKLLKKLSVLESLGMSKNDLKQIKSTDVNTPVQTRLNFKKM